jgi:hypothetical protein
MYCSPILIKFGTQYEQNVRYARFVFFLNKAQQNMCFVFGREAFSIHFFNIDGTLW